MQLLLLPLLLLFAAEPISAIPGVPLAAVVVVSVRFVAVVAFGAGGVANAPHHAAGAWGKRQKNQNTHCRARKKNKTVDKTATLMRRKLALAPFRERPLRLAKTKTIDRNSRGPPSQPAQATHVRALPVWGRREQAAPTRTKPPQTQTQEKKKATPTRGGRGGRGG